MIVEDEDICWQVTSTASDVVLMWEQRCKLRRK